jgi:hypothetical protein
MDPHDIDADPDSTYHPDAYPAPDPTFHPDAIWYPDPDPDPSFQIKAQTLEKVLK